MSSIDKLIDLLKSSQQPSWIVPAVSEIISSVETVMSVIPNGKDSMAQIEFKDKDGRRIFAVQMNLAALDNHIGKLITIRDALESVTK